ncbi:hypothetical protein DL98DRAFT_507885 [Cadophora sp. DSE1049]|nr:hypothetical protein DL98DRAFT_507885 [Cadophora sp. DSE1049]
MMSCLYHLAWPAIALLAFGLHARRMHARTGCTFVPTQVLTHTYIWRSWPSPASSVVVCSSN